MSMSPPLTTFKHFNHNHIKTLQLVFIYYDTYLLIFLFLYTSLTAALQLSCTVEVIKKEKGALIDYGIYYMPINILFFFFLPFLCLKMYFQMGFEN